MAVTSSISSLIFCLVFLFIAENEVFKSVNYYCWIVYFCLHVFWCSVCNFIYLYDYYIVLIDYFLIIKHGFLSLVTYFCFGIYFSDILWALHRKVDGYCIFFLFIWVYLYLLKCVSYRQHVLWSFFIAVVQSYSKSHSLWVLKSIYIRCYYWHSWLYICHFAFCFLYASYLVFYFP